MHVVKMKSALSGGVTVLALALMPLGALASGPGTASSNLTTVTPGYTADGTGNAQALSNAQFTVMPGDLTLNAVPNLLLSNTNVKNIATGDTALNVTSDNTSGGAGYDGNGTGALNVSDYRGDHAGWALTVGMGPFTASSATIDSATLNLNMTKGAVDNSATTAPQTLSLTQANVTNGWVVSPQTLWTAAAQTGEGSNVASTANTSSLQVAKQPTVSQGVYTATLYWALQNAPTAPKASS